MRHDLISDLMSAISNGDKMGKRETWVAMSTLGKEVLLIMQKNSFIGEFEHVDDGRGGIFKIKLTGSVNKCGSIRPRFSVRKDEFEKWERRFLPAAKIGLIIVSTSKGLMTHREAMEKGLGGKLIGYVY